MDFTQVIDIIAVPVLSAICYIIYINNRNISLRPTHDEVRQLIADKLAVVRAEHEALVERIQKIEIKLDKIIDILTHDATRK